jgi:uncharacterized protein
MKSRRNFIKQCLAVSAGFTGLSNFLSAPTFAASAMNQIPGAWLELREGFAAKVISTWGEKMSDGLLVPGNADGMAAFAAGNKTIIVRNHENSPTNAEFGAFGKDMSLLNSVAKEKFFDYGYGRTPGLGGTTTVIYDERRQVVEEQFLSLAGTYRNCAGGLTPWNSWITCEEDVTRIGEKAEKNHGYNFEVPATGKGLVDPQPLKAMGKFNHEAVCVDPSTGIVYQTEDAHDGLIYRFIPDVPGQLHRGGKLQALAVKAQKSFDSRNWTTTTITQGQSFDVEWITLADVDPEMDDLRLRGFQMGATVFARGEGMWFGNNEVYFACTNGGVKKAGQIFKYVPSPKEGKSDEADQPGKLILFAEPNDTGILRYCDNLTVSPWGDVILVEDSDAPYIRGISRDGKIYNIGRNIGSKSELTGVCFSPSGNTLFVNVQHDGITLAVTGPWDKLRTA